MNISRDGGIDNLGKLLLGVSETDRPAAKQPVDPGQRQDQVAISPQAKEMQRIRELVLQPDSARTLRIEQLRQAIADGTYTVKSRDVADALLKHALTESVL